MKKINVIRLSVLIIFMIFSNPGFSQWIEVNPLPQTNSLKDVFAFDSNNIVAVGDNYTIIKTTNAGQNWNIQINVGGTNDFLYSVFFADINTGWCVGYNLILKTTNGGYNWISQVFPSFSITPRFNSVYFINNNTGWTAGGYGSMLKTTDGGNNWIKQYFTGSSYYSVFFLNENIGWVTGGIPGNTFDGGVIAKTMNGGNNWSSQYYGSGFRDTVMNSIFFTDFNTGWTAGFGGRIYKSTNGGTSWFNLNTSFLYTLNSIYFYHINTGWIVGGYGRILATSNGGNNFENQISGTTSSLNSVKFIGTLNGWIVGDFGVILRTTNGGVTGIKSISTEIPDKYSLFQNYPNPFNPTTNIKFEISKADFVNISIFNLVGNKITDLVNENLNAGIFNVDWNGNNFSSGVYYYKLTIGNYSETRKMLLLK